MAQNKNINLEGYYDRIQIAGKLRTRAHAHQWSTGVLKTLGVSLDRGTKKALAKTLPQELSDDLKGVFWLLHFRDRNQSSFDFRQRAARRSGNSDAEFALHPTIAVFSGIKMFTDEDLDTRVRSSLSPELSELWQRADLA